MTVDQICSLAFKGMDVTEVDVQIQINPGIPSFTIVGLADKTIAESRERVRASLNSIGVGLPAKRIVINLAPADIEKEGSYFDLPIACAILVSIGVLPKDLLAKYLILGELSLNGSILRVNGVLPAAIGASSMDKGIICPYDNGNEAVWSGNEDILAAKNLLSLINHFSGSQILSKPELLAPSKNITYPDIDSIVGNELALRALEISAAGRHNLLMFGPPGAGKSMLASRMPGILPDMTSQEILECTTIASIAGAMRESGLIDQVPFRAPHHTCSAPSLVGGGIGKKVKPGEISLAHNGVLFLDELPEFTSNALDALRQPIETGKILISRVNSNIEYPANFQFIAAMNPCKCGYIADPSRACNKAPACGTNYLTKVSGPLLDRFDITIEVPSIYNFVSQNVSKKTIRSKDIKARVIDARKIQERRFEGLGITTNGKLDSVLIKDYIHMTEDAHNCLNDSATKFKFSMRGYYRSIKLARTIADLAQSEKIYKEHIAESINYRIYNFA